MTGVQTCALPIYRTDTPVILVINAKGASTSLLAVIEGFLRFVPDNMITGVLFDWITPATYKSISEKVAARFGKRVAPVGYIPELPEECRIPSRHLGLVAASEIGDISSRIKTIAEICEKTIDIDRIISIADTAPEIVFDPPRIPEFPKTDIAVAMDQAFFFYYRDTFRLLEKMGGRIRPFSPLADEPVPEGCSGLMIGGGYPELYARKLSNNVVSRQSVCEAIRSGMPTIAECGGFQYLGKTLDGEEMCGVLPHESFAAGKLVRFGYITLITKKKGLLGDAGTVLPAHEFHYWDSTFNGDDLTAKKTSGRSWDCAVMTETLYAGYPHLFLPAAIPAAAAFYRKCLEYKGYKVNNDDNSRSERN